MTVGEEEAVTTPFVVKSQPFRDPSEREPPRLSVPALRREMVDDPVTLRYVDVPAPKFRLLAVRPEDEAVTDPPATLREVEALSTPIVDEPITAIDELATPELVIEMVLDVEAFEVEAYRALAYALVRVVLPETERRASWEVPVAVSDAVLIPP